MLKLHNVMMKPSNVRKKMETTKCKKITVTYNVETAQCDDEIVKYEKKVRKLPNVRK